MQSRLSEDLLNGSFKDSPRSGRSPYWNIFFLAMAWALTLTTSTLLTSIGPLSAKQLGASKSISAFTIGAFLIGAALSSVPSGYIFRKYGRLFGFSMGCVFQVIGSALGALSLISGLLPVVFIGCFFVGLGQGLGQFYRFSAVEVSPDHLKTKAVTYVLSGGVLAAFLGPTSANYSASLLGTDYLASYLIIAVIAACNQFVILFVEFPAIKGPNSRAQSTENPLYSSVAAEDNPPKDGVRLIELSEGHIRSMREIVQQPMFIVACTIATLAHTVMIMIMSNVSLAMESSGFQFSRSSLTLELHFLGMFAPGFFTATLIQRYGSFPVAFTGAFIFAASSSVLAMGTEFWNYAFGMVLNGLGWNFCFSAGTVMLTSCYKPIEASEVQAVNDFIIFTVAGAGSLISGVIYSTLGWRALIYIVSGLMGVYLMLFMVMWQYAPEDGDLEDDESLIEDTRHSGMPPLYGQSSERNTDPHTVSQFLSSMGANPRGTSFSSTGSQRRRVVDADELAVRTISIG
ncbi:major facilitator superfamily domain-containing protein [Ochromonadaceae sp. CCMP2298]|nr:major facilitator superfamily domain-containing protein [Ochromonadaceae sp. CCMP2298]|mmetsp:Transcript_35460/g.78091  ORF Transcript_35460/g.78091 Transcript_35460/m.78091 type:complete len:515 (+) Transcript_35460:37-1581(+)